MMIEIKAVVFVFRPGNAQLVFPQNGHQINGTINDVIKNAIEWKKLNPEDSIGVFNDHPGLMDVGPAKTFVYQW